jgi:mevalonate kinase
MDTMEIIFGSIIGSALWLWILYIIIKSSKQSATQVQQAKKQTEYLEIQMRLQAELLKRQGVTNDELIEIINLQKSYFPNKL